VKDSTLPPVDELPVLDDLKSDTLFTLAVNAKGNILIFYNKPLQENPDYVECDVHAGSITLAYDTGRIQNLGIGIPLELQNKVNKTEFIFLVHMEDKKERSVLKLPFFIKS
tara:strand:+ start:633 stop:965 length:333 start_codon:yes stop_codon:yes gene_type:complete